MPDYLAHIRQIKWHGLRRRRGTHEALNTAFMQVSESQGIDIVVRQRTNNLANVRHLSWQPTPQAPRALRSRIIGHDHLVLITRPEHPWARRTRPVTAQELADTPLVTREEGSGTREALTHALHSVLGPESVHAAPVMALSTTSAVRAAVLAGAGPAVLSALAVADDLTAGRLVAIDVPGVDLTRKLRAVWIGSRTPPAGAVRDLLSHIASTTAAESGASTTGPSTPAGTSARR